MSTQYFHGSPNETSGLLPKGTYVTRAKHYALFYALRSGKPECYIYRMTLDSTKDIEQRVDLSGTVDYVLLRDTPYVERIPVTDEVRAECKAAEKAEVSAFLD
jgi:hypothetical protein